MKKIKSYMPIAILGTVFLAGILECFKAKAFMGDKVVIICPCCQDGTVVALGSVCGSGSGTCEATNCPSGTTKVCDGSSCP